MEKIKKDMMIMEALELNPGLAGVLQQNGLNCFGCPSSRGKTLEMAAANHGVDIDKLVSDMNAFLQ